VLAAAELIERGRRLVDAAGPSGPIPDFGGPLRPREAGTDVDRLLRELHVAPPQGAQGGIAHAMYGSLTREREALARIGRRSLSRAKRAASAGRCRRIFSAADGFGMPEDSGHSSRSGCRRRARASAVSARQSFVVRADPLAVAMRVEARENQLSVAEVWRKPQAGISRRHPNQIYPEGNMATDPRSARSEWRTRWAAPPRTDYSSETKPFFLTSEFLVYVLFVMGLGISSLTDNSGVDGRLFWILTTIATSAYMLSRGIAKAASRSRAHDPRDDIELTR
jgi:hypothetical protein